MSDMAGIVTRQHVSDVASRGDGLLLFPNTEGNRSTDEILSWDIEPGDDVRICFRPQGMDPDVSQPRCA